MGYPKIPKYDNIVVVAKKNGISHISQIDQISQKKRIAVVAKQNWDIQVVCQYPEIITMFDVADFKQLMSMIFPLSFIIGVVLEYSI